MFEDPYFEDYDKRFPDIVLEILEFFDISNREVDINKKTVICFCTTHGSKKGWGAPDSYEPLIVHRICMKLYHCGEMEYRPMGDYQFDIFRYITNYKNLFITHRDYLRTRFNSLVYGFKYVYNVYKKIVHPVVVKKQDGSVSIGTCFEYCNGLLTAKHCFDNVVKMNIKGYRAEELKDKPVFISPNVKIDIAYIQTGKKESESITYEDGKIMDEVLVLGYPRIPGYDNFLTAEKATIASKSSTTIKSSRGSIVAIENQFLLGVEMLLITARIKGGNSGGPIINDKGNVVGITCQSPNSEGDYDEMGYGIALPISLANMIIDDCSCRLKIKEDFFIDSDSEFY